MNMVRMELSTTADLAKDPNLAFQATRNRLVADRPRGLQQYP